MGSVAEFSVAIGGLLLLSAGCSAQGTDLENETGGGGSGGGGGAVLGGTSGLGTGAIPATGGGGGIIPPPGGSGGYGGVSGGGVGATANAAGTLGQVGCPPGTPATTYLGAPTNPSMITHLENGQEFAPPPSTTPPCTGRWHTFNDGSGTQTPISGSVFLTDVICPLRTSNSARAAHTWGNGFTTYAGMGFWINNPGGQPFSYDASAYSGITFFAKGTGAGHKLRVASGATCGATQSNWSSIDAPLGAAWQQYTFSWGQLGPESGSGAFSAAQFCGVEFWVAGGTFDYWVDDVAFTP